MDSSRASMYYRTQFYPGGRADTYRPAGAVPSLPSTGLGYNTVLNPDHDCVRDDDRGGTRCEQRTSAIGGSYYNHRPTLTGLVADDYHGADARNGGFVVTS